MVIMSIQNNTNFGGYKEGPLYPTTPMNYMPSNLTHIFITSREPFICINEDKVIKKLHNLDLEIDMQLKEIEHIITPPKKILDALFQAVINNNLEFIKTLVEDNPELFKDMLQWKDQNGNSIVALASSIGQVEILKLIIKVALEEFKIAINMQNNEGFTPVALAVFNEKIDVLKLMIEVALKEVKIAIILPNKNNNTPVDLAASKGQVEILKLIIIAAFEEFKIAMRKRNSVIYSAFGLAALEGHVEVLKLMTYGAPNEILNETVQTVINNDCNLIKSLTNFPEILNKILQWRQDDKGNSALVKLIIYERSEMLKMIILTKSSPKHLINGLTDENLNRLFSIQDPQGNTLLHNAQIFKKIMPLLGSRLKPETLQIRNNDGICAASYHSSFLNVKDNQFMRKKELLIKANKCFEKYKIKNEKPYNFLSKCSTIQQIVNESLRKSQGFCIGEDHAHMAPKFFLTKNMVYLKEKGVTVLFMEQFYDHLQDDLDNYAKTGDFPQSLENNINQSQYKFGYKEIVIAARSAGIRIIGIDNILANIPDHENRIKSMNYVAYKIIKKEIPNLGNNKYVILTGSNHMSHRYIPGLPDLLNCPRLIISDFLFFINQHSSLYLSD
jgi:Ankyrin repeats (3 copies)